MQDIHKIIIGKNVYLLSEIRDQGDQVFSLLTSETKLTTY